MRHRNGDGSLSTFLESQLACATAMIPVIEHGLRHPFAQAANHLLETLDNAYGDTPGLRIRINALRARVVEACALRPKPQPMPLWMRQGKQFPPHLPPAPSEEKPADLTDLRRRRAEGEPE
ncbi:MAG: hypothetical protein DYG92_02240 [Leptolyngbya sp. PLA1]|nr:hypothetical protein [Leptolyngbya sp. PLA1]